MDADRDDPIEIGFAADAEYRGFLFADLRDYTAFVERMGDRAAADLLDAYRDLVRAEVARFAGAEIRTEGDSFYVVFRSGRRAVACGLGIISAAERMTADNPERPIRVGIGINAGETVQRDDGFVGAAVNLAARVCAQARQGEVLVTVAVRDTVGAGSDVHFISRGTRRLKGIARPVELFVARRGEASEPAPRRIRPASAAGPWALFALGAVMVVGALAAWGSGQDGRRPAELAGASSPVSPVSTASTRSITPSATLDPDAWPNAAEQVILDWLGDEIAPHCKRADVDAVPRFRVDEGTAEVMSVSTREPLGTDAGVACEIPSVAAPDVLHVWTARHTLDFSATEAPGALVGNRAGFIGALRGPCGRGSAAYDRWEFGGGDGWLLCREEFGDAVIEWSYDDTATYAVATRRDGDLTVLLSWWRGEARLLGP
ncbi:MAG: adenylate/guanylate cyclase domain-containing protein [Chloroflexota bacterium]|nr:adenylate/guanylate cyclase domain-containing protein [Chloroflexota bacterium]